MLDAKIGEFHGVFLRLDRVACDLELKVELQEREVVARHIAHERQNHRMTRVFRGEELRARRFCGAAQFPKKIQLERGVCR